MAARIVRHPLFLSLLSGLLLALAFPPFDIGFLAFVALVPLLAAIDGARPGQAFVCGLCAGFVYFGIVYDWMPVFALGKAGAIGAAAGVLLALIMALFVAVFAIVMAIAERTGRLTLLGKLALAPSLWLLIEYVRQLGSLGMGWGDLGYTQWRDPVLLRLAPLTGVWGISWVVVLMNAALATRKAVPIARSFALVGVLVLLGPFGKRDAHPIGTPYVAAALQANINQDVPWKNGRPADPAYYLQTMTTFAQMAAQAHGQGAQLALMAETAIPGFAKLDYGLRNQMQRIADDNDLVLVGGSRDFDFKTVKERNVAVLFDPATGLGPLQMCAKQQLVPFGEFVPFENDLQWLKVLHMADFDDEAGGSNQPPLDSGSGVGKIGVSICYESTYPRFSSRQVQLGANILTVITDDTWFGRTSAARQHFVMSAVRAAECDRYLVRCAATGISGAFAPDGSEIAESPLFTKQVVTARVASMDGETAFVRYGDWVVILSGIVAAVVALSLTVHRKPDQDDG